MLAGMFIWTPAGSFIAALTETAPFGRLITGCFLHGRFAVALDAHMPALAVGQRFRAHLAAGLRARFLAARAAKFTVQLLDGLLLVV